ncbi:MAG TPA: substrate-binding domain-containing protein [Candidatus Sulfotelmatobacter sp.]|nr:substrate-binding domain-containing protein [Candidatus Sulfotelmatobacter sp.]
MKLALLVLAVALPSAAMAADVRILAAAAVAPGLSKVAEQYRKDTKNRLRIQYANPQQLERRVGAGESADVLIGSPGLMNDQLRRNKIEAEKHIFLGRVGIGVAIRSGGFDPDIATLDRFKQALLGADAIVYAQPGAGTYLEKLFELLGIGEQLKPKTVRYAGATQVLEHIAGGKAMEIGFATLPEIRLFEGKGVKLIGPLPEQIQQTTAYSAAVMTETTDAEVAREFIQYLESPSAKAIFASAGFDN